MAVSGRQAAGLEGRERLARIARGDIARTPQLMPSVLYKGLIHLIAAEPGAGKTLLALMFATEAMRLGGSVLYLDTENGPRLIAERLRDLGANLDTLDERFHYFFTDLSLRPENLRG